MNAKRSARAGTSRPSRKRALGPLRNDRLDDRYVGLVLHGQFELLEPIGAGRMALIYEARDVLLNRQVAVKIVRPELAGRTEVAARLRREARAMGQLNHPNIAHALLFGESSEGSLYIVMEYVHGITLDEVLDAEGPLPPSRVVPLVSQVCAALQAAHDLGILHSHVTPRDIMVVEEGEGGETVKLLDFGLARVTTQQMGEKSKTLQEVDDDFHDHAFLSPEQIQRAPLTPASDVYSLATVLHYALVDALPFPSSDESPSVNARKIREKPPPIDERAPHLGFSAALVAVLVKALHPSPKSRYATMREFRAALDASLRVESVQLGPPGRSPAQAAPDTVRDAARWQTLFSWVHLSDIHIGHGGPAHRADQDLVLAALHRDLRQIHRAGHPAPDAIFVTGDVSFSGAKEQLDRAGAWLGEIAASLKVGLDRIFLVPGNHDVQRAADRDPSVARLVRALRSGGEDLDAALLHPPDATALGGRQSEFFEFLSRFAPVECTAAGSWCHVLRPSDDLEVQLVGLNTALLSAGDDDRGHLRVAKRELARAFASPGAGADHPGGEHAAKRRVVFVLSHHPLRGGWLADESDLQRWVAAHADIHLCGHVHDADVEQSRGGGGTALAYVVSGAAHGERLPPGVQPSHGYNLASLVSLGPPDLRLRVWPRRWADKNKDFRVDVDNVGPNGCAEHAIRVRS